MTEYITKDQAYLCMLEHWDGDMLPGDYDDLLRELPPADVAPVVHARWEGYRMTDTRSGFIDIFMRSCSHCRKLVNVDADYKYCPQCGAKMDGGENE